MSIAFCILGSGSAGNSTLVRFGANGHAARESREAGPARYVLIDAGLSPRMTARRMSSLGVRLSDLSDIVLTHLDRDHLYPGWLKAAKKHDIELHMHRGQRSRAAGEQWDFGRVTLFDDDGFELGAERSGISASFGCIHFAHDDLGTAGFVIEHGALRLGFATDIGHVPETLFDCFTDLHALAFESNYDRAMQLASARPGYLKKRIMGGRGHLSNEQALDAVMSIAAQSRLSHVALLHLSRQCNCPRLVRGLYERKAPALLEKLTVSSQHEPTPLLHVTIGDRCGIRARARERQLALF